MDEARDLGLAELEAERSRLRAQLAQVGEFRQGSLTATYRRCGNACCACTEPSHPGHGPIHLLAKSVRGKTATPTDLGRATGPAGGGEKVESDIFGNLKPIGGSLGADSQP